MPLRVVLRDGVFHPIDPIPEDWPEGIESEVAEPDREENSRMFDHWCDQIESIAAENGLDDLGPLNALLDEADREAKARMRREMGLPR